MLSCCENILDMYVRYVHDVGCKEVVVSKQVTICGLIFLDMCKATVDLCYVVAILAEDDGEDMENMIGMVLQYVVRVVG